MLSNPNNGITGNQRETDLLDKLLMDKPPEVKARVLEVVYRLGISPHDELFLVMLALGYLQVLIQDSPKEWEELFFDFKTELDQWTDSNLEILDTLIRKAQTEEMLAKSCQQLVRALSNLTTSSNELMRRLQMSTNNSHGSSQTQNSFWKDSLHLLHTLQHELTTMRDRFGTESHALHQSVSDSRQQIKRLWMAWGATGAVLLVFGWHLWGAIAQINQRSQWMWETQLQQVCLSGQQSKTSRVCAGLK